MNKYNIGIIGNGFVGAATVNEFSLHANVRIYDANPKLSIDTLEVRNYQDWHNIEGAVSKDNK